MMQTFVTALAAQPNITLQTEQVKKATRATLNATKFLTRTSEGKDKETEQNVNQSGRGHEHFDGDNRPLKILQWNLNSFNTKRSFLMATAYLEQVDVILLQETHIKLGQTLKVLGISCFL